MNNELQHYGVKGMKWGVRKRISDTRKSNRQYRDKLTAISENENISRADRHRIEYRNHNLLNRTSKQLASRATGMLISEAIFSKGGLSKYSNMSKNELQKALTKKAGILAIGTTASVLSNDILAKSASKKYDDTGKRIKKESLIEREDVMVSAVKTATVAIPILAIGMGVANHARYLNEKKFNSWNGRILQEKVDHVIWQSDDLEMAVLDNK